LLQHEFVKENNCSLETSIYTADDGRSWIKDKKILDKLALEMNVNLIDKNR